MVFLSLSARVLINVEALNMVESVGNVSRHRRATIIIPQGDRYVKVQVPAISGESLAHAYQEALVHIANEVYEGKAPICQWCARGEFFKEMDNAHSIPEARDALEKAKEDEDKVLSFEEEVVKRCLVEDLGGFLRAERPPARRTSRFQVGYMVPCPDSYTSSVLESQFHVRHAISESVKGAGERAAQMIYYVEVGSALYGLAFNMDFDGIGKTSMVAIKEVVPFDEKAKRVKVALGALLMLLSSSNFGAKLTRFLPLIREVKSVCVALSDPIPFTVIPPSASSFISDTANKSGAFTEALKSIGVAETVKMYAYSTETEVPQQISSYRNVESLFKELVNDVETILSKKR